MVRMEDLPEGEREMLKRLDLLSFDSTPFVTGKPLSDRRGSVISTAVLQRRDDRVFANGEAS